MAEKSHPTLTARDRTKSLPTVASEAAAASKLSPLRLGATGTAASFDDGMPAEARLAVTTRAGD